MIPGIFYAGINNIKNTTQLQDFSKSNNISKFYSTSSDILNDFITEKSFCVSNDLSMYYFDGISYINLKNALGYVTSTNILRNNEIVISAGRIYNEQVYFGGNENLHNNTSYNLNIGISFDYVGIFDEEFFTLRFTDETNDSFLYATLNSNNVGTISYSDTSSINDVYIGNTNEFSIKIGITNTNITIKIYDKFLSLLSSQTYPILFLCDHLYFYLSGLGNFSNRYMSNLLIYSNLDNGSLISFLNGSYISNAPENII